MSTGTCNGSGCTADVRWVLTEGGRRMPIDPDPHPDGTVVRRVDGQGRIRAHVLTGVELPAQEPAWRPHWTTCPASAEFRRRQWAAAPKCIACKLPLDRELTARTGWPWHPCCAPPTDLADAVREARAERAARHLHAVPSPREPDGEQLDLDQARRTLA